MCYDLLAFEDVISMVWIFESGNFFLAYQKISVRNIIIGGQGTEWVNGEALSAKFSRGGGDYHICRYGMCHFWGAFFRTENKFWGIIFGKITTFYKFWGVILEK